MFTVDANLKALARILSEVGAQNGLSVKGLNGLFQIHLGSWGPTETWITSGKLYDDILCLFLSVFNISKLCFSFLSELSL